MKKLYLAILAFMLLIPASASAQYVAVNLPCAQGGKGLSVPTIMVPGLNTPTNLVGSYPLATADIYNTGTLTHATIYSTSTGGALSNPTSCDATGYLHFFVATGTYDITFSGNSQQLQLATPFTITGIAVGIGSTSVVIGGNVVGGITGLDLNVNSAGNLSQVPNIVHSEQMSGADCGVRFATAQAALPNGGTIDMRGETGCTLGTQDLAIGDGTHYYTVYGPTTITRAELVSTGVSARICTMSNVTLWLTNTSITGPGDVNPALGECYSGTGAVSNLHIHGGTISDTGSVVPGTSVVNFGGPNLNMTLPGPPTASGAYASSGIGSATPAVNQWFTGSLARVAVYNTALSAATIATNYANHTNLTTYDAGIIANSPVGYWKLNEPSGTTAADSSGNGRTATYNGSCILGVANGINGAADTAPEFDGSSCYVRLPSFQYLSGGNYTLTVWANASTLSGIGGANTLLYLGQSTLTNFLVFTDNPGNGGLQIVQQVASGGLKFATRPQSNLTLNNWVELDEVYSNGGVVLYFNGQPVRVGTDVAHSTIEDMSIGGSDYGLLLLGENGCICYNRISHIVSDGTSIGFFDGNVSGFAGGVNSNEFNDIVAGGAICIADEGGIQNHWSGVPDLENCNSGTGQVLLAEPDVLSPGSSYLPGDIITGTGCSTTQPTFQVNFINGTGGVVSGPTSQGLTVLTRGSGCANHTNVSTTGGTGTGLTINQHVSASFIANGYTSYYDAPYIEASANSYMCGGGNTVWGPAAGVINGSTFSPTQCPGVVSNVWGGPNSPSPYWGYQNGNSGLCFGCGGFLYDPDASSNFQSSNSNGIMLFADGSAYAYNSALTDSLYGWSPWHMGISEPVGGTVSTGLTTFGPLTNPSAPTLTVGCTAGGGLTCATLSAAYGLVFTGSEGTGHTAVASPATTTASGPSALGAIETATVVAGGTGFTGGTVGETCTVTGGSGTGEVTIATVSGGKVLTVTPTSSNLGTGYNTQPYPGGGGNNLFATSCGTGSGLTVSLTSSYIEVSWPAASMQGVGVVTVLETDTGHRLQRPNTNITGSTNASINIFDFGGAYTTVSWDTLVNTSGNVIMKSLAQLVKTAFTNLPTCAAAFQGYFASVSDSTTNTWGATITGSGADPVMGYCDGTDWTVFAK